MTSKEALRYLTKALYLENYPTGTADDYLADDYAFSCLLQLNKDLEVLALIREHLHSINSIKTRETIGLALFSKRYQEINKCGGDDMFVSKEDFEKITQWVYSTGRYDKETMEID